MIGIQTEYIGTSRNPTKRKRYINAPPNAQALTILSAEWQALLIECVKNGANARWQTWERMAGLTRKALLAQLGDWLLKEGWLAVYEEKYSGDWWPYKVEFLHFNTLQRALGLDVSNTHQSLQAALMQLNALNNETLQSALESLYAMPASRALGRAKLLLKLHEWRLEARSGTYRDFALYARDNTKALTASEWQWLENYCDLNACGIERHAPLLLISADIALNTAGGELNLAANIEFAAITAATAFSIKGLTGQVKRWVLIENRTSFERQAKKRQADEAIIWLPGFPPSWWQQVVVHLIGLHPAPVAIACDPDPAGIAIAWQTMQLLMPLGVVAQPWQMDVAQLTSLKSTQALNAYDLRKLNVLLQDPALPTELHHLALAIQQAQYKGEQESYL